MIIKELPSYKSLLEKAARYPTMDIQVTEAYLHVLRTGTILRSTAERILAKLGLNYGRFMLLGLLSTAEGPVPICKLADMAGVTTATVSAVLAGMVRDGLILRQGDPSDRRVIRVALRPEGQKILDDVFPILFEHQAGVMSGLRREEFQTLVTLLSKIRLNGDNDA